MLTPQSRHRDQGRSLARKNGASCAAWPRREKALWKKRVSRRLSDGVEETLGRREDSTSNRYTGAFPPFLHGTFSRRGGGSRLAASEVFDRVKVTYAPGIRLRPSRKRTPDQNAGAAEALPDRRRRWGRGIRVAVRPFSSHRATRCSFFRSPFSRAAWYWWQRPTTARRSRRRNAGRTPSG